MAAPWPTLVARSLEGFRQNPGVEWRAAPYQPGVTRPGVTEASDHRPEPAWRETSPNEHVAENVISRRYGVPVPVVVPPAARNQHLPRTSETYARPAPAGASEQLANTPPSLLSTHPAASAPPETATSAPSQSRNQRSCGRQPEQGDAKQGTNQEASARVAAGATT